MEIIFYKRERKNNRISLILADIINRHDGNLGRWHSTDKKIQENYKNNIKTAIPRIVNQF